MGKIFKFLYSVLLVAVIAIGVNSVPVFAESNVQTDIAGHTYLIGMDGATYGISFTQGPFGPGPQGTAYIISGVDALTVEDITASAINILYTVLGTYDFSSRGNLIIVKNFANFYYSDYQLIWMPTDQLIVLNCSDCIK